MTEQNMTLGARILANQERAKTHPLDVARERAGRRGQAEQFQVVEAFYDRFKKHVIDSVEEAEYPTPLRISHQEERALELRTTTGMAGEILKSSIALPVWDALESWAEEQELHLNWKQQHDGGGEVSWWTLGVTPHHP